MNDFELTLKLSFKHPSRDVVELQDHINDVLSPDAQKGLRTIMEMILVQLDVEKYSLNMRTERNDQNRNRTNPRRRPRTAI